MMNAIGGNFPGSLVSRSAEPLTNTQTKALDTLLSNVDVNSLSDDEARALVSGIKDAGISEGRGLAQALGAAGVDAGGLAEQAGAGPKEGAGGPGGPGGPGGGGGPQGAGGPDGGGPGGGAEGADEAAVQIMQSIVDQLSEYSEDEEYQSILLTALEEAGLDPSQPIVDLRL